MDRFGFVSRSRGLLLGLALGDAHARRQPGGAGLLTTSCAVQLVAFTVEGLIRASVRYANKGLCHPPTVVWHAYQRWGLAQGLDVANVDYALGGSFGPAGWLYEVPLLGKRRGSAPATVKALERGMGTIERPTTDSAGAHAAVRGLAVGALAWRGYLQQAVSNAREIGALTHGSAQGYDAAAAAAALTAHAGSCEEVSRAVRSLLDDPPRPCDPKVIEAVEHGYHVATERPADARAVVDLALDASAVKALAGGVYVASSFASRDGVLTAFQFMGSAGISAGAAAVAGALLGSAHGVDALPVRLVSQLEMVWVLDTLARDLVTELEECPAGGEQIPVTDPHWWSRYPGY